MNFGYAQKMLLRLTGTIFPANEFDLPGEIKKSVNVAYRNTITMCNIVRQKTQVPLLNFQKTYQNMPGSGYTASGSAAMDYVPIAGATVGVGSGTGATCSYTIASGGVPITITMLGGDTGYKRNDLLFINDSGGYTTPCWVYVTAVDSLGTIQTVSNLVIMPTVTTNNEVDHLISARYYNIYNDPTHLYDRTYNLEEISKASIDGWNWNGATWNYEQMGRVKHCCWERSEGILYVAKVPMGCEPGASLELDWSVTPDLLTKDEDEILYIPDHLAELIPARAAYDKLMLAAPQQQNIILNPGGHQIYARGEKGLDDTCKRLAVTMIGYLTRVQDIYFSPLTEVYINNLVARWL
jgi:hypothetical protein